MIRSRMVLLLGLKTTARSTGETEPCLRSSELRDALGTTEGTRIGFSRSTEDSPFSRPSNEGAQRGDRIHSSRFTKMNCRQAPFSVGHRATKFRECRQSQDGRCLKVNQRAGARGRVLRERPVTKKASATQLTMVERGRMICKEVMLFSCDRSAPGQGARDRGWPCPRRELGIDATRTGCPCGSSEDPLHLRVPSEPAALLSRRRSCSFATLRRWARLFSQY